MVKYCGYLVRDEWLFQRGFELGRPRPVTAQDTMNILLTASSDLMMKTNVYCCTKFRHVKTAKGISFWCIAFAANDTREGLPTSAPPEEKYKALKDALQKKGPPRWYQAS